MRENLKKARVNKGLAVAEIAMLANISPSFYYKIESGLRNPTMNLAKKISDILEKDINHLFFSNNLDKMSKGQTA